MKTDENSSVFFIEWDVNFFLNLYFLNLLFVGTYGITASLFSDWVSNKIFKKSVHQELSSLFLHFLFGLPLLILSLVSAGLFFIVDRLLRKITITWRITFVSFAGIVGVFLAAINFLK